MRNSIQPQSAFVYPVIHRHTLGSCRGRLKITGESIAFVVSGDSKDGFTAPLHGIIGTELGNLLKIKFRNKNYRFQSSCAKNKEDNRAQLSAIYQQLIKLRAGP